MSDSLIQKLGQLLIVGFHGDSEEDPWVQLTASQIEEGILGGVILFSYNVQDGDQLKRLTQFLHEKSAHPLFVTVDQEGGRVQRLSPKQGFEAYPSALTVAQGSLEEARAWYQKMARELKEHGINLDFAPCTDVNPERYTCPVIGGLHRSYSSLPAKVVEYARTTIESFEKESILSVIKHFPGHGSATGDSHEGFVDVSDHWDERELIPFYKLTKENVVGMVMTAHIFNKHLDLDNPATLSEATLDLLRAEGYDGVIISDDLHMGAIQQHYDVVNAAIQSLSAGCDMLILSNNKAAAAGMEGFEPSPDAVKRVLNGLVEAVQGGRLSERRVEEAYNRVMRLKKRIHGR